MNLKITVELAEGASHFDAFEILRKALVAGVENATERFHPGDGDWIYDTTGRGRSIGVWRVQ